MHFATNRPTNRRSPDAPEEMRVVVSEPGPVTPALSFGLFVAKCTQKNARWEELAGEGGFGSVTVSPDVDASHECGFDQ